MNRRDQINELDRMTKESDDKHELLQRVRMLQSQGSAQKELIRRLTGDKAKGSGDSYMCVLVSELTEEELGKMLNGESFTPQALDGPEEHDD